jgi:mono/diheme cytochrome c family protein
MRATSVAHALLVPVLAVASACGGEAPAPATPPAAPAASASAPAAASTADVAIPAAWSNDMTKPQQIAFMKKNVMPVMGKVFTTPGGPAATCATCHGPNLAEPKDFLPKLTMKDGKITAFADKPDVAKFMATTVTPTMAQAMGEKPFDPATHTGFGCNGCHTVVTK